MGCPAWDFLAEKCKNRMRNKYIWMGSFDFLKKTRVVISLTFFQNLIGKNSFQNILNDEGIVNDKNGSEQ